mmetsp:Transcript_28835/g.82615  ORF Transcript_28835/g.82615 Transcript_28835/m.82615 type:complete len:205 (-) Transcript_28835:3-617(-)
MVPGTAADDGTRVLGMVGLRPVVHAVVAGARRGLPGHARLVARALADAAAGGAGALERGLLLQVVRSRPWTLRAYARHDVARAGVDGGHGRVGVPRVRPVVGGVRRRPGGVRPRRVDEVHELVEVDPAVAVLVHRIEECPDFFVADALHPLSQKHADLVEVECAVSIPIKLSELLLQPDLLVRPHLLCQRWKSDPERGAPAEMA